MATITGTRIWITLASDLTQSVVAASSRGGTDTAILDGQILPYAGGRRRLTLNNQDVRTLPRTLRNVSDHDLATLDSWRGQVVLLRDRHGRRIWGTYLDRAVVDYADGNHDVTINFSELTYDESV